LIPFVPRQLVLLEGDPKLWPLLRKVREDILAHIEQIAFLTHPLLTTSFTTGVSPDLILGAA
jgi:hypothetical protein